MFHLRVMGMMAVRTLSLGALREMASFGADGFRSEAQDAGHDAGGGDGHARFGDADFVDEQADGVHEGVVVEEGLAHAHEDEVDAVAPDLDLMALEDGDDLSGDFSGGEVADDAELRGEAELAVDRAADLAGDADGGVVVAGFAAVSAASPPSPSGIQTVSTVWPSPVAIR